jgi:uncharacterized membrane protein HdeD (DUF308 family)
MEPYLIQLLGLYLVIVGAVVLVSRRTLMPALQDLAKNRGVMMVLGALEIIAGLALVLAYPTIEASQGGVLAVLGYVLVIGAPKSFIRSVFHTFNRPGWFIAGGVLAVFAGLSLLFPVFA